MLEQRDFERSLEIIKLILNMPMAFYITANFDGCFKSSTAET